MKNASDLLLSGMNQTETDVWDISSFKITEDNKVPVVLYYVTGVLTVITLPLYLLLIIIMIYFRKIKPFSGCFFKITLIAAFYDLMHIFVVWPIERIAYFGWSPGFNSFLMSAPQALARLQMSLWWVSAFGQRVGTLFTALNRVTLIVYNFDWEIGSRAKTLLWVQGLIPWVLGVPKYAVPFTYVPVNATGGLVAVQMIAEVWQDWLCLAFCNSVGIICGVCYLATFVKARNSRMRMQQAKSAGRRNTRKGSNMSTVGTIVIEQDPREKRKQMVELKLAIMGAILGILTMLCGFCVGLWPYTFGFPGAGPVLFPVGRFLLDLYAIINPYLMLLCSDAVLDRTKRFLRCDHRGGQYATTTRGSVAPQAPQSMNVQSTRVN